jgi:hypothetical protein
MESDSNFSSQVPELPRAELNSSPLGIGMFPSLLPLSERVGFIKKDLKVRAI